jgi:ABC-type nitrate/sulfonate/bicarbonate transport system permease component
MKIHKLIAVTVGLLPIGVLLILWQVSVTSGAVPAALLPLPGTVIRRFAELTMHQAFWGQCAITLLRLTAGLGIGIIAGIALGLAAGASATGRDLIEPVIRVLAPVPKIALYPALALTLGFADASKIALVAIETVFPILMATYQGSRLVEPKLLWWARSAGVPPYMLPLRVILPSAAPTILVGVRIGLVIGCVVVFLAEMIMSTDGLGHGLALAARTFHVVDMFVPLIAISIIGLLAVRR